jgi:hypothetical protein
LVTHCPCSASTACAACQAAHPIAPAVSARCPRAACADSSMPRGGTTEATGPPAAPRAGTAVSALPARPPRPLRPRPLPPGWAFGPGHFASCAPLCLTTDSRASSMGVLKPESSGHCCVPSASHHSSDKSQQCSECQSLPGSFRNRRSLAARFEGVCVKLSHHRGEPGARDAAGRRAGR